MKANMSRKLKCLTSAPARLSVAMPLIFGLATIAAAPTVEAVTVREVDIVNGAVDVTEGGLITAADDLNDVALWCNDAAPVRVDIVNGGFDVNEDNTVTTSDDLFNCDLTDENDTGPNGLGTPTTKQVDILNGVVDVNESGAVTTSDDAANINLFVLP